MKHRKGIDLVRADTQLPVPQRTSPPEDAYRIEVWSAPPEEGGSLIETISRSSDFNVSAAAFGEALRRRVGRHLIHMNGRSIMRREIGTEATPRPEQCRLRRPPQPVPSQVGR